MSKLGTVNWSRAYIYLRDYVLQDSSSIGQFQLQIAELSVICQNAGLFARVGLYRPYMCELYSNFSSVSHANCTWHSHHIRSLNMGACYRICLADANYIWHRMFVCYAQCRYIYFIIY